MKNRGIIVISSLVVIGGGVAFLLWKLNKKKEEQKLKDEEAAKAASSTNTNTSGGGDTGGGGGGGTKPSTFTFPFKSEMEGNMFRVYVRFIDKPFADSIKLDATGKLNSTLQKAWDKYGVKYLETKPKLDNPKLNNPTVPKKGNTLAEVAANLKTNGFTVNTFKDRVTGYLDAKYGGTMMASFRANGSFGSSFSTYWTGATKLNSGTWEDSGNIITLKSGRILNEGIYSNLFNLFTLSDM